MERIGFFGGSFDPVHFGHLHLAIALSEAHQLDRVVFVPAARNPLKPDPPVLDEHRLNMLELALEGLPAFQIDKVELSLPPPSFTVETLAKWKLAQKETAHLFLLLGEDAVRTFHLWKDPLKILSLAEPLVCSRSSKTFPSVENLPVEIEKRLKRGWTEANLMEISATEIRNRLKQNKFCGHLLPSKVLAYILKHRLYSFS